MMIQRSTTKASLNINKATTQNSVKSTSKTNKNQTLLNDRDILNKTNKTKNEEYDINPKQILTNYLNQLLNSKYEYDYFLAQLKQKQHDCEFMSKVIKDLKECVHFLEPSLFENLVYSLFFDVKWYLHVNLLNDYKEFLSDLISAHTQYIYKCLTFLIKLFLITKLTDPSAKELDAQCKSLYEFSHSLIINLIKIAPSCKAHVVKLADQMAPYMIKDTCIQEAYVNNLVKIANNLPELRLQILEICIQKMLKIDVNAPRDQIVSCEIEDGSDNDDNNNNKEVKVKHPFADRLDVMMLRLFEFISDKCKNNANNELDWNECKLVYKDLLFIFDKYILSTYGSSHVQFLLFHICSYRINLSEGFLDYLWKKFSNPNTCPITRQLCTFYIGKIDLFPIDSPLSTLFSFRFIFITRKLHTVEYNHCIDAANVYVAAQLYRQSRC